MSRTFQHRVRVPYAHTDQMGFVYYAHYFVYFEMARAELLREVGLPYSDLESRNVMLPVVQAHCDYKQPARFDDELTIETSCPGFQGARLCLDYSMTRGSELIATGHTHHVCMTRDGRVMKPIPELRGLSGAT